MRAGQGGWIGVAVIAVVVVAAGCESESGGAPEPDAGAGDVGAAPDLVEPAPDPASCELHDYGNGEIWDGTVDAPTEGPEPEALKGILAAHNAVRRYVGVPELAWSEDLAADAQEWADHLAETRNCGLMHSSGSGQGENLAAGGGTGGFSMSPQHVLGGWVCEREDWDNDAGTCQGEPGFGAYPRSCGHYTQVVWSTTTEVGCGVATCDGPLYDVLVYVCRYTPPGNWVGRVPY